MKTGWKSKRLINVCEIRPSKDEARKKFTLSEKISFVPMEDLHIDEKFVVAKQERVLSDVVGSYTYFSDGDVLLAKITPCFENGKLGIAKNLHNGIGFGSSEFIVFRPSSEICNEWLYYYLLRQDFRDEGEKRMGGAVGQKRVSKDFIETYEIPLPPLPEQQRIVAVLDEAFAAIVAARANAERNLRVTRELFESYLNEVLIQHHDGWVKSTLGVSIDLLAGFAFKSSQYTNDEEDIRLLSGDNIIQGSIRWDDVRKWPVSDFEKYTNYQLKVGDVVLAMDRPWVKAGIKCSRISTDDIPSLLVQRTARLRCKKDLDKNFLFFLLESNLFARHILGVQTGLSVPHISGQQIKDFSFMKPPMNDQIRIANTLDMLLQKTQQLSTIYQQKLLATEKLKQSLLHHAFTGQL